MVQVVTAPAAPHAHKQTTRSDTDIESYEQMHVGAGRTCRWTEDQTLDLLAVRPPCSPSAP